MGIKLRAHEVIARAVLDSGLEPHELVCIHLSWSLLDEFREEVDVLARSGFLPLVISSSVLGKYQHKYSDVTIRAECKHGLRGDEVLVNGGVMNESWAQETEEVLF